MNVVLPFAENIKFKYFSSKFVYSLSPPCEVEPCARSQLTSDACQQFLQPMFKEIEQKGFSTYNPVDLLLPVVARSHQIFFDCYGGSAVYFKFTEQQFQKFDLDRVRSEKFNAQLEQKLDEEYLVFQILVESGLFGEIVVQKGRWGEQGDEVEVFESEEEAEAAEETNEDMEEFEEMDETEQPQKADKK